MSVGSAAKQESVSKTKLIIVPEIFQKLNKTLIVVSYNDNTVFYSGSIIMLFCLFFVV